MADKIKVRTFPESNYRGIYCNNKTLRIAIDPSKPITDLEYPEFYDIKITNQCNGKCPWCYQNSVPDEEHYPDILSKVRDFFGSMSENQKPFQTAIGGGEATLHPEFIGFLKFLSFIGITPNYTTNGTNLTDEILRVSKEVCGGVAISCHEHLREQWSKAIWKLVEYDIDVNLHIIISDTDSIDKFIEIYNQYSSVVSYFVLLPHMAQGRAKKKDLCYQALFDCIENLNIDLKKIAFGANFYPYLKPYRKKFDISLYEPEIMSKFLDLKDMKVYKSSFETS